MITPKDIFEKSSKQFLKIATSVLNGRDVFPLILPSNKAISGTNYSELKSAIVPLYQQSKAVKGAGYSIDWKEKLINGTKQSVPAKIYFETLEDYLHFIGRRKDFDAIKTSQSLLINAFPNLGGWVEINPSILLSHSEIWENIIKVCQYFQANKPPHSYYIRELPIEVHSKFIEQNASLLKKLLDILLPTNWINFYETDFASRYGVKKVNVYTQIRILDDDLKPILGYDEVALTLDDAAWLKWIPEMVFIIENQICYLTFPKVKNSVALFGEGFKSRIAKHIPWIEKTKLYCWFDLDPAGFEMLDIIRKHYPNTMSFLMDTDTYMQYSNFAVDSKYRKKELQNLTLSERQLYEYLQANNKRLEQERIPQDYILNQITKFFRNQK